MNADEESEPHGDYIHMTHPERVEFLRRRQEWALRQCREREEFVKKALERREVR